jgi:hypothetical protein
MKNTFQKSRSKLRTVLMVVAPSAVVFIGLPLAGMASLVILADPFHPSVFVLIGAAAVAVTAALVTVLQVDRRSRIDPKSVDRPWPDL